MRWWIGMCAFSLTALVAPLPTFAAEVPADSASPFTLLEGQEVARTTPIRDVRWQVFGHSTDGARILAANDEGVAILDVRGEPKLTPKCSLQRARRSTDPDAPPPPPEAEKPTQVVDVSAARDGFGYSASFLDGEVCTWDAMGNLQSIRRGTSASTLADAKTLVLGFADGRLEGRNPKTGGKRWGRNPELGPIVHMRMERNGPRVAASTGTMGVSIIDTRSGRLVRGLRGRPAWSAAFSDNGARVAVGRANGRVELWDTKHWVASETLRFDGGNVIDLDWSVDGTQLAAATVKGEGASRVVTLEVYDFALQELVFRELAPAGPGPTRFRFDNSGDRVIAGNGPGAGRVWSKPGARQIPRPLPSDEPPHQRPFADRPDLPPVAVVPPKATLAEVVAASPDGRLWLHRVTPLATVPSRPGQKPAPPPPPVAPVWMLTDLDTGAAQMLAGSSTATGPFVVSNEGRVAGLVDGRVQVWGRDGVAIARIGIDAPAGVTLLGERMLLTTQDGKLYAGTVERLKLVPNVAGAAVAAFDPVHPNQLAVGGADGTVRIVDLRGATQRATALYDGPVRALAFSDDARLLAASGPGATSQADTFAAGVVIVRDQEQADAAPWRAVVDTPPTRLAFVGTRLFALGDNAVHVLDPAGMVLDLSANVVTAGLSAEGVRWADPAGAIRVATPAATPLATIPRGRLFATSPDRKWAVTVDGDTVSVWEDLPGKLIRELPSTGQAVLETVFSDTGDRLAVLAEDRAVEVYDVATGEALRNLDGPPVDNGTWLRFDDKGRLWTFTGPRDLAAVDIATGEVVERVTVPGSGPLRAANDNAYGRFVELVGPTGAEGWLDVLATSTRRLTVPADGFRPIAGDPKGTLLAGVAGAAVERRDAKTGRRVGPELVVEGDTPAAAGAWSNDGAHLAVTYTSGLVRVWDLERNKVAAGLGLDSRQIGRVTNPVASLSFSAADDLITTRDASGHPRIFEWNLSLEGSQVGSGAGPVLPVRAINALAVSPDGKRVFAACGDDNARAFDLSTGVQTEFYWGHAGPVTAVVAGTNGRLLTGSEDGTVRSWEIDGGIDKADLNTFGDAVRTLSASRDGWRVAAAGDGKVARTWDVAQGKALRRWRYDGALTGFHLGVDGASLMAEVGGWWTLDPNTGATQASSGPGPMPGGDPEVRTLAEALGPITASVWTPDRKTWISAHDDGRIRVWSVDDRALRLTLIALTDGSWVVDRPDGTRYASESLRDGTSPLLYRPPPR